MYSTNHIKVFHTCLCEKISVCVTGLVGSVMGRVTEEMVWTDSSLINGQAECNRSRGNYWASTSISCQDGFLFAIVCVCLLALCSPWTITL